MKYVPLFLLIQLINLPLLILGVPVCGLLALVGAQKLSGKIYIWPAPFWIWSNAIDGVYGPSNPQTRWQAFYWTALRNPVSNFRLVKGVSGAGRPLWYWSNGKHYAKAGWVSTGWPVLSAGAGRGF
jgi:hypothetical protein